MYVRDSCARGAAVAHGRLVAFRTAFYECFRLFVHRPSSIQPSSRDISLATALCRLELLRSPGPSPLKQQVLLLVPLARLFPYVMESSEDRQQLEITALRSIYDADFLDCPPPKAWKVSSYVS